MREQRGKGVAIFGFGDLFDKTRKIGFTAVFCDIGALWLADLIYSTSFRAEPVFWLLADMVS